MRLCLAALAFLAGVPGSAGAQSALVPHDRSYLGIEVMKPSFGRGGIDPEPSFGSLVYHTSFRYAVEEKIVVVGSLPIARWADDFSSSEPSTALGNLSFGLEGLDIPRHYGWEFGITLPTASTEEPEGRLLGILTDLERWEGYFLDVVSVRAGGSLWFVGSSGSGIRIRLSPILDIPTESGLDKEFMGLYSGHYVRLGSQIEFVAGLLGRVLLSEEEANSFAERTIHQSEIGATFRTGKLRLGATLRTRLDDGPWEDGVASILGIHAGVVLD